MNEITNILTAIYDVHGVRISLDEPCMRDIHKIVDNGEYTKFIDTIHRMRNRLYPDQIHIRSVHPSHKLTYELTPTFADIYHCNNVKSSMLAKENGKYLTLLNTRIRTYAFMSKNIEDITTDEQSQVLSDNDIKIYTNKVLASIGILTTTRKITCNNWYSFITREVHSHIDMSLSANSLYHIVSQLVFFTKYINYDVLFITGDTGVGKSTQTPRFIAYANIACDYNFNPRVICCQPRISPVRNTSKYIRTSLGVSLKHISMAYSGCPPNECMSKSAIITFITDGLYFNQLINNTEPSNVSAVLIDEVHEHNVYQDMLISILRNYINKRKVFLLSATMDKEYPLYKSFYGIMHNNSRYHLVNYNPVSKHDIQEFITPTSTPLSILNSIYTSPMHTYACILVFVSTINEVNDVVNHINDNIPDYLLALPFHSNMNDQYVDAIAKHNKHISIDKADAFDQGKVYESIANEYNRYRYIVIVATNIAESAITISDLIYVIDNGKQLTVNYDVLSNQHTSEVTYITHQSSIQRRGRVGRTQPGVVYYLYDPSQLHSIDHKPSILSSDITSQVNLLLKVYSKDSMLTNFFIYQHTPEEMMKYYERASILIPSALSKILIDISKIKYITDFHLPLIYAHRYGLAKYALAVIIINRAYKPTAVKIYSEQYGIPHVCKIYDHILSHRLTDNHKKYDKMYLSKNISSSGILSHIDKAYALLPDLSDEHLTYIDSVFANVDKYNRTKLLTSCFIKGTLDTIYTYKQGIYINTNGHSIDPPYKQVYYKMLNIGSMYSVI